MAKSVQERSAKAAQKRIAVAEKELRHKVRPGIEQAMERIRLRGQVPIISEVLQIAIMKMDLMANDELIEFLRYPRHEIVISENVAREFHNQSLSEIRKDPGDKILSPSSPTGLY
ncbi:hypothetical protein K7402_04875 [Pseudomonas fluorescens group sp.]|uniref:Uncharacterized protein n=2 Tax=Pseudomonas fluorescens TaxID=294 RepID=C3KA10_PSEFS|nr:MULTISPECIES: hypothetical protein [Pseudomonas fluorescens group]MBZ6453874.1 hypothetical protein [Pseudomonas fluorescens group sp.]MBZ6459860.1 hypothetical protein [Pseudomonas fluorescens group sp.]MBZ6466751.1 hypothetical protein [Pseudomonas fluorescens group sp.]WQD75037.1 hypothetical protein U0037_14160 [Pseudomonas marginalis]CAI2797056.1 Uncharacterized protein PFLU_2833 [Pseudomonas fluorescens SBW25]